MQLAAYRIVQESLTNALRHAGPATAAVRLDRTDDELVVEIVDTGRGDRGKGDGLGITGMRARAEALGGTLDAAGADGGGFAVRARLPVRGRA
ncbi:ATP-binding protein [Pseudonocardia humida]|uniref:ATP-binding protein n=1 Tax=Pseudonocardia humida TaxID=2800819 RepID=UPI00207C24F1|nr:ATP-binding protein [Pseudonocardia humida]